MKLSLYQRLALSLAALFLVLVAGLGVWTNIVDVQSRQEAEQRLHLGLAEHLVTDNPRVRQGFYDYEDLSNLFHTMMVLGPAFEFYLLDASGKILTYSAPAEKIKRDHIDLVPVLNLMAHPQQLPILGDDPRHLERQKIFSAAPVHGEQGLQGYLYVIIGGEQYDSVFDAVQENKQLAQRVLMLLAALVFLFIVMLVLLRVFTAPLRRLSDLMCLLRRADFNIDEQGVDARISNEFQAFVRDLGINSVPNISNDIVNTTESANVVANLVAKVATYPDKQHEIQHLGVVFVQMVQTIHGQFQQLKANDAQRRELLAQLSHDLRTPLAALQGYLETLDIKYARLSEDESKQFIHTALSNALILKSLVDQIFELAHLESGQVRIELESFPVAELLHDVAAKFAIQAESKGVTLRLPDAPCLQQVSTDIGKLERVLSNLIDNALRHTDAGGEIHLHVEKREGKRLQISVIDTGSGIPENDMPYIFDARYRGSNATGKKHQHGGFGLAICQRLLGLLNTELQVTSEYGKGATFYFSVPLA